MFEYKLTALKKVMLCAKLDRWRRTGCPLYESRREETALSDK